MRPNQTIQPTLVNKETRQAAGRRTALLRSCAARSTRYFLAAAIASRDRALPRDAIPRSGGFATLRRSLQPGRSRIGPEKPAPSRHPSLAAPRSKASHSRLQEAKHACRERAMRTTRQRNALSLPKAGYLAKALGCSTLAASDQPSPGTIDLLPPTLPLRHSRRMLSDWQSKMSATSGPPSASKKLHRQERNEVAPMRRAISTCMPLVIPAGVESGWIVAAVPRPPRIAFSR